MTRTALFIRVLVAGWAAALAGAVAAGELVSFHSPGFPASQMDAQGRLVEDWATVGVKLSGEGVVDGPVEVKAVKLEGIVPAAQAVSARGAVRLLWTAYRAPAFPSGVDVLSVRVEAAQGKAANVTVALDVPPAAQVGLRTVKLGPRTVLTLPTETLEGQIEREWGYCDEATSLPGGAKPEGTCDPACRNIRAGMGGVSIRYRFAVKPKSAAGVALGFCESHWDRRGQRPMLCLVEGAPAEVIDPIARWGRHKPGVLVFRARDQNGDGKIDITVRPAAGAPDRNPILNAIWFFPPNKTPEPAKIVSGEATASAMRYVDVGGQNDQSLYPPGKLEYRLAIPAGGAKELTFLVACHGDSAPMPGAGTWTPDALRRAAIAVWRDWADK
jgi:hypothetical protein